MGTEKGSNGKKMSRADAISVKAAKQHTAILEEYLSPKASFCKKKARQA